MVLPHSKSIKATNIVRHLPVWLSDVFATVMSIARPFLFFCTSVLSSQQNVHEPSPSAWVMPDLRVLTSDSIRKMFCDAWQECIDLPNFQFNDWRHLSQALFQR